MSVFKETVSYLLENNEYPMAVYEGESEIVAAANRPFKDKYKVAFKRSSRPSLEELRPESYLKNLRKWVGQKEDQKSISRQFTIKSGEEWSEIEVRLLRDNEHASLLLERETLLEQQKEDSVVTSSDNLVVDKYMELNEFADKMDNAVVLQNVDGEVEWINESYQRLTGLTEEMVLGRHPIGILKDYLRADNADLQVIEDKYKNTGQRNAHEIRYTHYKSGNDRWMQVTTNPIRNDKKELKGYLTIGTDVTRRRRLKSRHDEVCKQLAHAQKIARIGFWYNDLERGKSDMSKKGYELLGVEKRAGTRLNLETFGDRVHEEDKDKFREVIDHFLKTGEPMHLIHRIVREDTGEVRYLENYGEAEKNEHGEMTQFFGVVQDVTDLKQQELKAQYNYTLFRQLFDNSPLGIALIKPEGEIIDINEEFSEMFGYTREKALNSSLYDLLFPGENEELVRETVEKLKSGDTIIRDTTRVTRRGEQHPVLVTGVPVEINGDIQHAFAIYADIKELKNKEASLRDSLQEKHVLLQEIHHRVKNNLAIVSGLLELQQFEAEEPKTKSILRNSQLRIQSMAKVHEALYKSENLSNVHLDSYLEALAEAIQQTFTSEDKPLDLKLNIDENIRLNINEAVPIALLLNELVTNAYQHGFEGMERGSVKINAHRHDHTLILEVIDDGKGIDKEKFLKYNSFGARIVHTLCNQLNAELEVDSGEGRGTRFTIEVERGEKSGAHGNL